MKVGHIAAKGIAALISFLLLVSAPAMLWADGIADASLLSIEQIDADSEAPDTTSRYEKRLSMRIGFRLEHLLVAPNPHLNHIRIVNSDGTILQQESTAYAGIIESLPNSWVRVVVDGDYIAGTIRAHGNITHFSSEPNTGLSGDRTMLQPLLPPPESAQDVFKRNVLNAERLVIDPSSKENLANEQPADEQPDEVSVAVADRLTDGIDDVTRVIRVGVVVDALYQEALGGRGLSNAIATINSVDGLYREKFGLAFKVDMVVLITDETFLSIEEPLENNETPTLKDYLNLFRDYRISSELLPDDLGLVHVFTGIQSEDQAIGLAFKGAACRIDGHDVSMSRPFLYPVLLTAHEIGHNLGADHDDTTDCSQIEDNLMFSAISASTTREFSSCSSDSINTRMEQSTCFTAVIDIDLSVTQLESNQIQINVTNLDESRAFPSATLSIDLDNTAITEAPANCELEDISKLICEIPATFAGDTQEFAIKLRLEQDLERTITMRLEANNFFDLNDVNNTAEVIIRGEPLPLAVTDGVITTQGSDASGGASSESASSNETAGGGGVLSLALLMLLLVTGITKRVRQY